MLKQVTFTGKRAALPQRLGSVVAAFRKLPAYCLIMTSPPHSPAVANSKNRLSRNRTNQGFKTKAQRKNTG
jgi:hypothetical protein